MRLFALVLVLLAAPASAQPVDPTDADTLAASFRVYTADGEPVPLWEVVHAAGKAEVVFLGEQHDDAVAHALQLRLLEALSDHLHAGAKHGQVRHAALSLEMFERDVQPVLDEYLHGLIRERDFLAAARPWSNYATDYRPLVEYAIENDLPVLAANAPGRYVNRVARLGPDSLDALSADAKATLPPLPVAPASDSLAAAFTALMEEMMSHSAPDSAASDSSAAPAHPAYGSAPTMANLLAAQNLRDAAMGWTIAERLRAHPDALVLHLNGSFHSEGGLGVPEHLERYRPGTRALVVTMRADDAFPDLDPEAFRTDDGGFVIVTAPRSAE